MKQGYFPQEIEKRWQAKWEDDKAFYTPDNSDKKDMVLHSLVPRKNKQVYNMLTTTKKPNSLVIDENIFLLKKDRLYYKICFIFTLYYLFIFNCFTFYSFTIWEFKTSLYYRGVVFGFCNWNFFSFCFRIRSI